MDGSRLCAIAGESNSDRVATMGHLGLPMMSGQTNVELPQSNK